MPTHTRANHAAVGHVPADARAWVWVRAWFFLDRPHSVFFESGAGRTNVENPKLKLGHVDTGKNPIVPGTRQLLEAGD